MAIDWTTCKMEVETENGIEWRTFQRIENANRISPTHQYVGHYRIHYEPDLRPGELVMHIVGSNIPKIIRSE